MPKSTSFGLPSRSTRMFLGSASRNSPLAITTGVFLIAAGVAIAARIRDYEVALAVTVLFVSWIVFLRVPSAFVNPALLRSPWWARIGCILFGISLPIFGVLHCVHAWNVASLVPSWYPFPLFWAYLTGTGKIAAGVAIAAGVRPRLAATIVRRQRGCPKNPARRWGMAKSPKSSPILSPP